MLTLSLSVSYFFIHFLSYLKVEAVCCRNSPVASVRKEASQNSFLSTSHAHADYISVFPQVTSCCVKLLVFKSSKQSENVFYFNVEMSFSFVEC